MLLSFVPLYYQRLYYQPWILPPLNLLLEHQFKHIKEREEGKKKKKPTVKVAESSKSHANVT